MTGYIIFYTIGVLSGIMFAFDYVSDKKKFKWEGIEYEVSEVE